jgi:hypothetical protein
MGKRKRGYERCEEEREREGYENLRRERESKREMKF